MFFWKYRTENLMKIKFKIKNHPYQKGEPTPGIENQPQKNFYKSEILNTKQVFQKKLNFKDSNNFIYCFS